VLTELHTFIDWLFLAFLEELWWHIKRSSLFVNGKTRCESFV
jgi:hypothetical protein